MHDQATVRKYFFLSLLLIGVAFAILLLWPFVKVIVLSIAITVVLSPVYRWLLRRVKGVTWLASLLTVLTFLIVLCVPLFIISTLVFDQTKSLSVWLTDHGGIDNVMKSINGLVGRYVPIDGVNIEQNIQKVFASITAGAGAIFSTTLSAVFSFFLVILSMFYLFKDGKTWKQTLLKLSPLSDEGDMLIMNKMRDAINGIVKGYLLIAIVQGLLMGIGFTIFGVSNAALWGVVAGVASLIPSIGTALVSIPAIIFLYAMGDTTAAIGMAVWAGVLVGSVDNVLNPYFVGRKIDIHPLLVLFAVLGGIALMGPIGILIGPLIISFLYALMSVYKTEVKPAIQHEIPDSASAIL